MFDPKSNKMKDHVPHADLTGISCSAGRDQLFVLHFTNPEDDSKADVILRSDYCIETLTKIAAASKKGDKLKIVSDNKSISHSLGNGKVGMIEFTTGNAPSIKKAKNGNLLVIAP